MVEIQSWPAMKGRKILSISSTALKVLQDIAWKGMSVQRLYKYVCMRFGFDK